MGNILILHSGLRGISNACLELAKRLELDGHVVYNSSIKSTENDVKNNGLNYIHTQTLQFNYLNKSYYKNFKTALFSKKAFFEKLYNEINFPSFEKLIKDKMIDLLLVDMELHEYIIYSEYRKIPIVLLNQFFPIHKKTLPLNSKSISKSNIQRTISRSLSVIMNNFKTIGNFIRTLGLNRRQFILYLARKLNYKRSRLKSFYFPLPFVYFDIPVLSLTHPELDFNQARTPFLKYTYPMVCEHRVGSVSNAFEAQFEAILEIKSCKQKKLIVVTQSTMKGKSNKFIPKLIEALSQLDECLSIISVGFEYENIEELNKHHNIYLFESIPQLKVFKHADLSINHGGIHTINECIHYGLPMLIISGNRYDQNGNAARVAAYGCGKSHFTKNITRDRIISDINTLLSNPKYKKKVEDLNISYNRAKNHKIFENYIGEKLKDISH